MFRVPKNKLWNVVNIPTHPNSLSMFHQNLHENHRRQVSLDHIEKKEVPKTSSSMLDWKTSPKKTSKQYTNISLILNSNLYSTIIHHYTLILVFTISHKHFWHFLAQCFLNLCLLVHVLQAMSCYWEPVMRTTEPPLRTNTLDMLHSTKNRVVLGPRLSTSILYSDLLVLVPRKVLCETYIRDSDLCGFSDVIVVWQFFCYIVYILKTSFYFTTLPFLERTFILLLEVSDV